MRNWLRKYDLDLYFEQLPLLFSTLRLCGRAGMQMLIKRKNTLNSQSVGNEYDGRGLKVTARKIELFAQATQDQNPLYLGHSKNQETVTPPMFYGLSGISSLSRLFCDKTLNLDFSGMFHAGQDIEFIRLAHPGEEVFAKSFVKKIIDRGKGEILVTNTHLFTKAEELIGKGYSSWYVKKPKHLQTPKDEEFREQLYWEPEDEEGIQCVAEEEVMNDQMLRYAKVSGDYNLIHISDFFAKIMGEGKKILQGMCTMALVAKAITNQVLQGNPHRLKRLNVRFLSNVRAGDVLKTYCWRIDPKKAPWSSFWFDEQDQNATLLGFKTKNQHGDIVVSRGVAKIQNEKRS